MNNYLSYSSGLRFCEDGQIYIVRPGDTIYRIAQRYELSVDAILKVNPGLNPDLLMVGQSICLPLGSVPVCQEGQYYTVKAGDTIYSIAKAFNVSLDALIAANPGIDPDRLVVGQKICIPRKEISCPPGGQIYTIKAGDTPYKLAQQFSVSVDAILKANPGMNPNALKIGQQICIPPRPPLECENIYVIKPGDNLYNLAKKFNISLEELIAANPELEDPANLSVGTNICIPSQKKKK